MAESAVLRRSFSNPSESCFQEADPLCALGESVSFGKYMSESLAWEKWSTFSHNRYLEEAEKYSKPGSVAKMKAYFEAHYKKIGAKKQAALDQANLAPSSVQQEVREDNLDDSSSLNMGGAEKTNELSSVDEESLVKENPDVPLPSNVVVNSCDSSIETMELQNGETSVVERGAPMDNLKDPEVNMNVDECSFEIEVKENESNDAMETDIVVAAPERKEPVLVEESKKVNADSKTKQKSTISSIRKSTKSNVSKLSSSLARLSTPIRSKKESCGTPKSIKCAMKLLEKKLTTPMHHPKKESCGTPKSRMSESKKPAPKLLHMSINSDANLTKKDSSQPSQRTTRMGKVFTPLGKIIRDSFASSPAPSRASVSSVSRPTSETPHTETKRSRVALEKAFDKSRKMEQKLQSPSMGGMKSSVQSPSPTTFSSFNFRTEERAAKRREFFQKRMEKEAEKMQPVDETKQEKPKSDFRKSCVNMKANPSEDTKTEVLSDSIKKVPPGRTESPKRRSKPSSDLAPVACSRPPQRSIGSKPGTEKAKRMPGQSSTLLAKKKRHENASPNIL